MITKENILEILHKHSYNIEDQAGNHLIVVDTNSWDIVATEVITSEKTKTEKCNGSHCGYTVLTTVPYQSCPICNGSGQTVADGFTSAVYQTCKVCLGAMIIPMHVLPQVSVCPNY